MMNYETKMKTVVDAKATENDAMNSLRMALIQKVLANTAARMQLEEVPECIAEAAEKAVAAGSIVITVGDVKTNFEGFSFMAKWDRDRWFVEMLNLFNILVKENCWYEDRLKNGFCWRNGDDEFCTFEIVE